MKLYYLFGRLVRPLALLLFFVMDHVFSIHRTRIIIKNEQGETLFIRGWTSGNNWEFCGGGIDRGEMPAAAIAREVHEELGMHITTNELTYIGSVFCGYEAAIFQVTIPKEATLKPNKWEIAEIRWFTEADKPLKVTKMTQLVLEKLLKRV